MGNQRTALTERSIETQEVATWFVAGGGSVVINHAYPVLSHET